MSEKSPLSPSSSEAHQIYTERHAHALANAENLNKRHLLISYFRVSIFVLGAVFLWLIFGSVHASGGWILLPIFLFIVLAVIHNRVISERDRANRVERFYKKGLLRLEDMWAGSGATGIRFAETQHPFANDLDLFGTGSLFELLSSARTPYGEETLAGWLKKPAAAGVVRARQEAVRELTSRLDLREELAVLGEQLSPESKTKFLSDWTSAPPENIPEIIRIVGMVLSVLALASLISWGLLQNPLPLSVMLALGLGFQATQFGMITRVLSKVQKPARTLSLMIRILKRMEREPAESPYLKEVLGKLKKEGVSTSARISELENLLGWQSGLQSSLISLLAAILLLNFHLAVAFENWRQRNGSEISEWLKATGEFEALCSLAGYAYEHPEDIYPEIADDRVCFEADELAHPLLSQSKAIRNSLSLNSEKRLYIVSGSNMSGKSTLMRSVGANTVLALAGCPVRAKSLRLSVLNIGASIRTQDSLSEGVSRFYAEIKRLSQIIDIGRESPPALFLIDEIMQGTNSHDRRIGAEAVARTLVEQGSIGIMTTHDLALTVFAEDSANRSLNVHFEDSLIDGKMIFDYHMRPGVVEKSNALALLRAVGIKV